MGVLYDYRKPEPQSAASHHTSRPGDSSCLPRTDRCAVSPATLAAIVCTCAGVIKRLTYCHNARCLMARHSSVWTKFVQQSQGCDRDWPPPPVWHLGGHPHPTPKSYHLGEGHPDNFSWNFLLSWYILRMYIMTGGIPVVNYWFYLIIVVFFYWIFHPEK